MTSFWDRFGISASLLCVIHCLSAPILALAIPFSNWFTSETFHIIMALVIFPVAIWALLTGYRKHRHKIVLQLGTVGLSLVALGLIFSGGIAEFVLTACGGVILALAHFKNLKQCQTK